MCKLGHFCQMAFTFWDAVVPQSIPYSAYFAFKSKIVVRVHQSQKLSAAHRCENLCSHPPVIHKSDTPTLHRSISDVY